MKGCKSISGAAPEGTAKGAANFTAQDVPRTVLVALMKLDSTVKVEPPRAV